MNGRSSPTVMLVGWLALAACGIVYLLVRRFRQNRCTAGAKGRGESVIQTMGKGGVATRYIRYSFEVDGRRYTGKTAVPPGRDADALVGQTLAVWYDPKKPSRSYTTF